MAMSWLQALKVFNSGGNNWCIPRKGTPEYDEVKAIMHGHAAAPKITSSHSSLTPGEKRYASTIDSIEKREKIRALARRVRPLSTRG